ncbi:MAG: D-alanine--D-alanine ligase, partial [Syntrophomonadaceae bacterium]|nr:D-alanine--D-alanine ligase [Syntrophomonadaceae bacterium]
ICMNKILTKKMLSYEGLPTADFIILNQKTFDHSLDVKPLVDKLGLPIVVKAATQGSSIGTYIVKKEEDIIEAVKQAFQYDDEVLLEKFIDGQQVTAAVIGNEEPEVLPVIEITSVNEFYDYESKYTPGMCEHIIPARINEEVKCAIECISKKTYQSLGCRGFARVDFMIDKDGNSYVLEINTIPGMTAMSLVPDAAAAIGINYEELVDRIINLALEK